MPDSIAPAVHACFARQSRTMKIHPCGFFRTFPRMAWVFFCLADKDGFVRLLSMPFAGSPQVLILLEVTADFFDVTGFGQSQLQEDARFLRVERARNHVAGFVHVDIWRYRA